ncbi:19532_t:CDS:2, partial [Dentiscutata erythropus]
VEASEACNNSIDELNYDEDGEISILRPEKVDNIITRLMQTIPEVTTHRPLVSDSDSKTFESDSEVETAKSYDIMSLENLTNTIKQLEKEVRSIERGHERIEVSIVVIEAARKANKWLKMFGFEYSEVRKRIYMDGYEYADVVAYHERFLERMAEFEAHMVIFFGENIEEETKLNFDDIIILVIHDEYIFLAYNGKRWL